MIYLFTLTIQTEATTKCPEDEVKKKMYVMSNIVIQLQLQQQCSICVIDKHIEVLYDHCAGCLGKFNFSELSVIVCCFVE